MRLQLRKRQELMIHAASSYINTITVTCEPESAHPIHQGSFMPELQEYELPIDEETFPVEKLEHEGVETCAYTPCPSPAIKKRDSKRLAKEQRRAAAAAKPIGCPRCLTILGKSGEDKTHSDNCDVGFRAVFRSIRRCAKDACKGAQSLELDAVCELLAGMDGHDPSVIKGTAELVLAFATTRKVQKDSEGLASIAHKVCYKWKREVHQEMIKRPEFQHMLQLPAFAAQKVMCRFTKNEMECRQNLFELMSARD